MSPLSLLALLLSSPLDLPIALLLLLCLLRAGLFSALGLLLPVALLALALPLSSRLQPLHLASLLQLPVERLPLSDVLETKGCAQADHLLLLPRSQSVCLLRLQSQLLALSFCCQRSSLLRQVLLDFLRRASGALEETHAGERL